MAATLLPNVKQRFFDPNGDPLSGGKLFSYIAGTTTPLQTYVDATQATPNTNPVILDANGEANVWIADASYKFVLKNAADVVQWTVDNVVHIGNGTITTAKLADGSVTTIKIADLAVTTAKIQDLAITTGKIADGAVTPSKIPDGSLGIVKLESTTDIGFRDMGDSTYGHSGLRTFPTVPWEDPDLVANPTTLPSGNATDVSFNPTGGALAVSAGSVAANVYTKARGVLTLMNAQTLPPTTGLEILQNGTACAWCPRGEILLVTTSTSPYVYFYQRSGKSLVRIHRPLGIPSGIPSGISWSPNGDYVSIAHATFPYLTSYRRDDLYPARTVARYTSNTAHAFGAGAGDVIIDYEDPDFNPSSNVTTGASWNFIARRTGGYRVKAMLTLATATSAVGYGTLGLYRGVSLGSGLYSVLDEQQLLTTTNYKQTFKGSDWIWLAAGDIISVRFTQTSVNNPLSNTAAGYNYIEITEDASFDALYDFAVALVPSVDPPAGDGKDAAWSPDSIYLAVGHATSPYLTVYSRGVSGLTKLADPSTLPPGTVTGCDWSPDGNYLAISHTASPYVSIYEFAGGVLTKLANPGTLPAGAGNGVSWSPNGGMLAVTHDTSPFITIYTFDGTTFTKLADPQFLPAGSAKRSSWTPDGQYLAVAHTNTPYLTTYKSTGLIPTDAVLYIKEVNLG